MANSSPLETTRRSPERECPVANDRPLESVRLMHDAGQLDEVFCGAGKFQHVDPADAVPLLQSPAHTAVAGERVVTEILADEEPPAFVLAFRHLELDSRAVRVIALETPELRRRENAQLGCVSAV